DDALGFADRTDDQEAQRPCGGVVARGLLMEVIAHQIASPVTGTRPDWYATTTSWARLRVWSFTIARLTCVRAVAGLTTSCSAISRLVSPSATSAITSRSRAVSSASCAGLGRSRSGWELSSASTRR